MPSTRSTCHCPKAVAPTSPNRMAPMLTGILIAILPKCPFCILAYSSAITMCGSAGAVETTTAPWVLYVSLGLILLTCIFLFLNHRGTRTNYAIALVVIGGGFILSNNLLQAQNLFYYIGSFFLLFGVWVNGSFLYVYRSLQKRIFPDPKTIWDLDKLVDSP